MKNNMKERKSERLKDRPYKKETLERIIKNIKSKRPILRK